MITCFVGKKKAGQEWARARASTASCLLVKHNWISSEALDDECLFPFLLGDTQIATRCKHLFFHDQPRRRLPFNHLHDRSPRIARFSEVLTSRNSPLRIIPDPLRQTSTDDPCCPKQALLLANAANCTRRYLVAPLVVATQINVKLHRPGGPRQPTFYILESRPIAPQHCSPSSISITSK